MTLSKLIKKKKEVTYNIENRITCKPYKQCVMNEKYCSKERGVYK